MNKFSSKGRIASVGECMLELSGKRHGWLRFGYGGDTLNTAVYMARLGAEVDYVTALGDDCLSDEMVAGWRDEGIGTDLVSRVSGYLPGIYVIRIDDVGERTFFHWREMAAARQLLEGVTGEGVARLLDGYDALYVTGVTLAILHPKGRERLFAAMGRAHAAGRLVAFDSNYRPRLWPDQGVAREAFRRAYTVSTIVLPSLDDEIALFGDTNAATCVARIITHGPEEVVVKDGPRGCLLSTSDGLFAMPCLNVVTPVDTTAAGDGFNAAYLWARMRGLAPRLAAEAGHRLARSVVLGVGAVIDIDAMPDMTDFMCKEA
ncbi:MAG: sugar kinase [Rhodospirillales bacterium]|jgi:2-dehydro-3-deoxygluconokinase